MSGVVIPESPVKVYHCGTASSLWLDDTHPLEGETKYAKVCIPVPDNDCFNFIKSQD